MSNDISIYNILLSVLIIFHFKYHGMAFFAFGCEKLCNIEYRDSREKFGTVKVLIKVVCR